MPSSDYNRSDHITSTEAEIPMESDKLTCYIIDHVAGINDVIGQSHDLVCCNKSRDVMK